MTTTMARGFGRRYYVASYSHRYSDPCEIFVSLRPNLAGDAAEQAMQFEAADLPGYCDVEHDDEFPESNCSLCNPDLCFYGERTYAASDLFMNLRELGEHRHDLAMGKVIVLDR